MSLSALYLIVYSLFPTSLKKKEKKEDHVWMQPHHMNQLRAYLCFQPQTDGWMDGVIPICTLTLYKYGGDGGGDGGVGVDNDSTHISAVLNLA